MLQNKRLGNICTARYFPAPSGVAGKAEQRWRYFPEVTPQITAGK